MSDLPPGFVLDGGTLPQGFVIDQPKQPFISAAGFLPALGHHLGNLVNGGANLIEHGIGAGVNGISNAIGAPDNPVNQYVSGIVSNDDKAMADRERAYQANTPNTLGSYAGATLGEVLPFVASGGGSALESAGNKVAQIAQKAVSSPLAGRVVSGATQGALVAAANPVTNDQSPYWEQKLDQIKTGGLVGGAIPVAGAAIGALKNGARSLYEPFTNPDMAAARNLATALKGEPLGAPYQSSVPGVTPTTAQTFGGNTLVQAEKASRNTPEGATAYNAIKSANDLARFNVLRGLAGTDESMAAAKQARQDAISQAKQQILENGKAVPVKNVQQAIDNVRNSDFITNDTVEQATNAVESKLRRFSQGGMISPGKLDGIRQTLNDAIFGSDSNQARMGLAPLRAGIEDSIESANPGYRDYLAAYAKASVPINTMEAVRSIVDGLDHRASDASGNPQLALSTYNSRLNSALNGAQYGIDPQAEQALRAIQNDLQRETISSSQRVPGSDTAFNLNAGRAYSLSPTKNKTIGAMLGAILGSPFGEAGMAVGGKIGFDTLNGVATHANANLRESMAKLLMKNPALANELVLRAQQVQKPQPVLGGYVPDARAALAAALSRSN